MTFVGTRLSESATRAANMRERCEGGGRLVLRAWLVQLLNHGRLGDGGGVGAHGVRGEPLWSLSAYVNSFDLGPELYKEVGSIVQT